MDNYINLNEVLPGWLVAGIIGALTYAVVRPLVKWWYDL